MRAESDRSREGLGDAGGGSGQVPFIVEMHRPGCECQPAFANCLMPSSVCTLSAGEGEALVAAVGESKRASKQNETE